MNKRRQAIADIVNQLGEIHIRDLRRMFPNISEVTLRKDLQVLDEENSLVRIHGGARSINDVTLKNSNFNTRTLLHQNEKAIIGEKAAKLIKDGMSVFISSGSTCAELAKQLPSEYTLQVFTDGISIALKAPVSPGITVELVGGVVNRNLMRLTGPSVVSALDALHFDYAFLGTMGFNKQAGFPVATPGIAASNTKAIEHSRKTVILMDSSKVNDMCTARNIPFKSVDIVISDGKLSEDVVAFLNENQIEVL
ncbi:MAG: DeoR/GlpR transcriptional regulator [Oscillospiraceae bacterium]|nr:DeoR/GlpR transcriptional regulator [Oscillospiraceae bacterium]MBQ4538475.1 DeoR/GlpR transcriptional regulator [Oscillospiraceae bacterium]